MGRKLNSGLSYELTSKDNKQILMKNKLLLLALLFPTLFFAQVGIGTTTPDASAKLEVSATDKGFLQPRVALNSTNNAENTISNPATGLMVYNTATAGSGDTAVTPGVYYNNGTAWQRVANQQSTTATTVTTTIVEGNLGNYYQGGGNWFSPYTSSKAFGAFIILPPGKWEVILNITCSIGQVDSNWGIPTPTFFMTYWLQDNQNSDMLGYTLPTNPTSITTDMLFPGGAAFTRNISLDTNHNGSFYIKNTTSSDKTYYLFFHEGSFDANTQTYDGYEPFYNSLGGSEWPGNRFYAVEIK